MVGKSADLENSRYGRNTVPLLIEVGQYITDHGCQDNNFTGLIGNFLEDGLGNRQDTHVFNRRLASSTTLKPKTYFLVVGSCSM